MVTDKNCCTSDTREIPLVHTAKNTRHICDRICDHAIVDTITLSRQIAQRPRDRDDRVTIDDVLSSSYFEIEMRRYVECACVFQFRFFFRRSIKLFYNLLTVDWVTAQSTPLIEPNRPLSTPRLQLNCCKLLSICPVTHRDSVAKPATGSRKASRQLVRYASPICLLFASKFPGKRPPTVASSCFVDGQVLQSHYTLSFV